MPKTLPFPLSYPLFTIVVLLAACSKSSLPSGLPPTFEGARNKEITFLEVGENLELEIVFTEQNGEKATGFDWIWETPESSSFSLTQSIEANTLRVSLTPHAPGKIVLEGRAQFPRKGDDFDVLGVILADVRVWGGAPDDILPVHKRLHLVPGERRYTTAFLVPKELGSPDFRTVAAGPVLYTTEDSDVATVTPSGLVEAHGVGETTLTMRHGTNEAAIPVTVASGDIGLPPTGTSWVDEDWSATIGDAWLRPSPNERMQVDSRGWPVFATVFRGDGDSVPAGQAMLVRWTGSGWGVERASRPYDVVTQPRLAIDENDTVWIVYWSDLVRSKELVNDISPNERSPVLAHRSVDDADWHHRALPHALDNAADRESLFGFGHPITIQPQRGGGAWVAYTSHGQTHQDANSISCVDTLHLSQATEVATREHTILRTIVPLPKQENICRNLEETNPSKRDPMLAIVSSSEDSALPRILSAHTWPVDCDQSDIRCELPLHMFVPNGDVYERMNLLRTFDFAAASQDGAFAYKNVTVARSLDTTSESSILIGLANSAAESTMDRTILLRDDQATWFDVQATNSTFGFRIGDYDYVHQGTVGTMHQVATDGVAHRDPYHHSLRLDDSIATGEDGTVTAWAHSDNRFFLLQDSADGLLLRTVPAPGNVASFEQNEVVGTRVTSNQRTPAVYAAPLILPGGKRVVVGSVRAFDNGGDILSAPAAVCTSQRSDESWSQTQITETTPVHRKVESIVAVDENLYTVVNGQLYVSSDAGIAWSPKGNPFPTDIVWTIHPDGRFAALANTNNEWHLYTEGNVRDDFSPVSSASIGLGPTRPGLSFGADGAIYALLVDDSTGHLELTQFTDNQAPQSQTIAVPNGAMALTRPMYVDQYGTLLAAYVVTTASADPVAPERSQLFSLRRDGTTNQIEYSLLGDLAFAKHARASDDNDFVPISFVALPDGTVVAGFTAEEHNFLRRLAVVRRSPDQGRTWGKTTRIRPTGGSGQLFVGMVAAPDGGLLAMISDNNALSRDTTNASQLALGAQTTDFPRMDDVIVGIDEVSLP